MQQFFVQVTNIKVPVTAAFSPDFYTSSGIVQSAPDQVSDGGVVSFVTDDLRGHLVLAILDKGASTWTQGRTSPTFTAEPGVTHTWDVDANTVTPQRITPPPAVVPPTPSPLPSLLPPFGLQLPNVGTLIRQHPYIAAGVAAVLYVKVFGFPRFGRRR